MFDIILMGAGLIFTILITIMVILLYDLVILGSFNFSFKMRHKVDKDLLYLNQKEYMDFRDDTYECIAIARTPKNKIGKLHIKIFGDSCRWMNSQKHLFKDIIRCFNRMAENDEDSLLNDRKEYETSNNRS